MKHMRKLVTLVVVLAMVMAFMVPTAMAATIEISSPVSDESYNVYKIFDATTNDTDGDGQVEETESVAYTISNTSAAWSTIIGSATADANGVYIAQNLKFTPSVSDNTVYVVTQETGFSASDFAAYLKTKLNENDTALGTAVATLTSSNSYKAESLSTGYYFVTSSLGSLCALATEDTVQTITEKNSVPSIDKKQSTDGLNYGDENIDVEIGGTVHYQIEIKDGVGTDNAITVADTMPAGATLNNSSFSVKKGSADLTKDSDYTLTITGNNFEIVLKDTYVASLNDGEVVTVQYTGTVNDSATINGENSNTVTMSYSAQSATDSVKFKTYDFAVKKTDGNGDELAGAKFNLYTTETGGTALKFDSDTTGYYLSATGSAEIDAGDGTGVNIRGLKPGTYWLEEIVTPEGYNKLAARQEVTITKDQTATAEVTVVNQAGTVLPSTGGMGTTIFYILGSLMVVGAAVVLVTNKRMRGQM